MTVEITRSDGQVRRVERGRWLRVVDGDLWIMGDWRPEAIPFAVYAAGTWSQGEITDAGPGVPDSSPPPPSA